MLSFADMCSVNTKSQSVKMCRDADLFRQMRNTSVKPNRTLQLPQFPQMLTHSTRYLFKFGKFLYLLTHRTCPTGFEN